MTSTARAVAQAIAQAGIDRVFGLPGGEVLVLIDELRRAGVDFVLMRHEANAGIAAAVYGKLRRQPGVVLATLGPGAANLLLPVANACLDQEPLLALTAQIPADFPASHTHQLLPLHDIYRPVTRYTDRITARNARAAVARALAECMRRPYGTAYLTLSTRDALAESAEAGPAAAAVAEPPDRRAATRQAVLDLTSALSRASRPLVMVGLGFDPANASRLRAWLEAWGLAVAVTPKVKGVVDETAAHFVGVIGGMAADELMLSAVQSADLRIGLGLDPVEVDKTWHAELPITWLLEAPNAFERLPEGVALVDHASLLDGLRAQPAPRRWDPPFLELQRRRQALLDDGTSSSGAMWPGDLVRCLASVLPPETIVTTDVGSHKFLFGQFWPSRQPETFWVSNGLSGMAYGLGAAVGAKLARPSAPVLAAVGDGGFSMNCQELETAQRIGAPFVTVVLEDRSYSLIKLSQERKKLEPYRMDFGPIDSVKVAEACGVAGLRTTDPRELAAAVREAVAAGKGLVAAVTVDYQDYRRLSV
jgi:acetolactate synthase I/II/III large subunit